MQRPGQPCPVPLFWLHQAFPFALRVGWGCVLGPGMEHRSLPPSPHPPHPPGCVRAYTRLPFNSPAGLGRAKSAMGNSLPSVSATGSEPRFWVNVARTMFPKFGSCWDGSSPTPSVTPRSRLEPSMDQDVAEQAARGASRHAGGRGAHASAAPWVSLAWLASTMSLPRFLPPWEQLLVVNPPPQGVGLGFNCPEQPRLRPTALELVPRLEP